MDGNYHVACGLPITVAGKHVWVNVRFGSDSRR